MRKGYVGEFQDITETYRSDIYESQACISVERSTDYQDEVYCVQEDERSMHETT